MELDMAAGERLPVTPESLGTFLQKSLTLSSFTRRPAYGRKIDLIVNYFPVELPRGDVYHYDVEVTLKRRDSEEDDPAEAQSSPNKFRCMNTKKNREIISTMLLRGREFTGYIPAYDGRKNLYTKTPLKAAPFTALVELPVRGSGIQEQTSPRVDVFEVSIKPAIKKEANNNAISLDPIHEVYERRSNHVPSEAVMAIETILRNGPCFRYVPIGRSFFFPPQFPEDVHPLSDGKEIWFGYHQSLILADWKPVVNINVTATTFRKSMPLTEYICEVLECTESDLSRTPQLRDADVLHLSKKLRGVRVKVTHLRYEREYRAIRLTRETAKDITCSITTSEGQKNVNVPDYFWGKYKIKLRYSQLPCLQVQPENRKTYLPLEVCKIVEGQHSSEKLTEYQTSKMIKASSHTPEHRLKEIQKARMFAGFNRDPCNAQFGIRVSTEPMGLEGRVIEPPSVLYQDDRRVRPKCDGSWEMKELKFFSGVEVTSWVLLSFVSERFCSEANLNAFAQLLRRVGLNYGLELGSLKCIRIFSGRDVPVGNVLRSIHERLSDVEFAVIVLESKHSPLYGEIKRISETQLGLITQCVVAGNVNKKNRAVISNICQKINAKMGGINCSLTPGEKSRIFNKPVIIIGADVAHPPPGSGRPSIAAVVASLDSYPSRYAVVIRAQKHTKSKKQGIEIIQDLEAMIKELLRTFYRTNRGLKPEKIIFYRDGVSEGQLLAVRDYELNALRSACKAMSQDYQPGITFIVVQKNHHTRFFPRDPKDGVGATRNIPPGTVVDKVATRLLSVDFFLCSHFGLQGTSRPGHYTVISDDNNFTCDELQKLTYDLCHIYARCTKSISIPSPVSYAHLAAYRAAKYLESQLDEPTGSSSGISDEQLGQLQYTWKEAMEICPEMKNRLYFV